MLTSLFRIAKLTQLFFTEMSMQCLHKLILHQKNHVSGDEKQDCCFNGVYEYPSEHK